MDDSAGVEKIIRDWKYVSYLRLWNAKRLNKRARLKINVFFLGSQTSLLESFETDQSNFKEKILHLLTDEPKLEKVYEIQKYWQNIEKVVNLLHFQLATFHLPR